MKVGFFLIMLLIVPSVLYGQYPVFGDERRPKGNIKSFMESCYDTSQGIKMLVSKNKFIYDQKGVLIERIVYDTIDSNKVSQKVSYIYEDDELFEELGETYRIRHVYDDKGKKLAEKYTSVNSDYLKRYDYSIDGELVRMTSYNSKGKLLYSESFKYDDQKALLKLIHIVPDSSDKSFQAIYTSDIKGRHLSTRVYATNGYILYTNKFNYDFEGQLNEEIRYNYSGAFLFKKRFKYVYDKAGNWTLLANKNKTSSYLTIREIQYN
ncbi:hypothetical protein [Pedobacter foliorum]|uniref:hypothetical protein n=1 Tax=Pedobacter foliorum TaxID=2739058 RepID=UPI00156382CC|nr:hypothetical protein [Pedobacter foliorum]NRF40382.1 hypothetical protein [Pedobacter foliorum]